VIGVRIVAVREDLETLDNEGPTKIKSKGW
jgi:hypothetical protein